MEILQSLLHNVFKFQTGYDKLKIESTKHVFIIVFPPRFYQKSLNQSKSLINLAQQD